MGARGWEEQAREAVTGWAEGGGRAQAKTWCLIRPCPGSNHQATQGTEQCGDWPAGMDLVSSRAWETLVSSTKH